MKIMPTAVTIVRPQRTRTEKVSNLVAGLIMLALRAWGLMLLVPVAFGINPGFWQAAAAIYAFSLFFGGKDHSLIWSRAADEGKP